MKPETNHPVEAPDGAGTRRGENGQKRSNGVWHRIADILRSAWRTWWRRGVLEKDRTPTVSGGGLDGIASNPHPKVAADAEGTPHKKESVRVEPNGEPGERHDPLKPQGGRPASARSFPSRIPEKRPSADASSGKPWGRGGERGRRHRSKDPEGGEVVRPLSESRVGQVMVTCRKRGGRWELAVVPRCGVVVRGSDGRPPAANGEFVPNSFRGEVYVEDYAGSESQRFHLYTDKPLVFQVGADWRSPGRKVRGVGVGHFVAIVPEEWTRWGRAPVDPEPCADAGFRVHYFYRTRGDAPGVHGFEQFGTVSTSVIELIGERLFDDSDQGELYVGRVPELRAPGMAWARVGEEGQVGWGETYRLDSARTLEDVLGDRQGWFFVRVYREGETAETDSVQFRYLAGLREIRVDGRPYTPETILAPGPRGHKVSRIEFLGAAGARVRVAKMFGGGPGVALDDGTITCPADAQAGELRCRLADDRGAADVVIHLPRVWWRLERPGQSVESWRDRSVSLTRDGYRTLALDAVTATVAVPTRVAPVGIGFDDVGRVPYPGRRCGRRALCIVPLRDFADHTEIDQRLFREVVLGARCGETIVDLLKVAADQLPEIAEFAVRPTRTRIGGTVAVRWRVERCEGVEVSLEPDVGPVDPEGQCSIRVERRTRVALQLAADGMDDIVRELVVELEPAASLTPRPVPCPRTARGHRRAKGFSLGEMAAVVGSAGLPVRCDRRRRSVHSMNIASLERWINGQR